VFRTQECIILYGSIKYYIVVIAAAELKNVWSFNVWLKFCMLGV